VPESLLLYRECPKQPNSGGIVSDAVGLAHDRMNAAERLDDYLDDPFYHSKNGC